jgi:hypothetical protein
MTREEAVRQKALVEEFVEVPVVLTYHGLDKERWAVQVRFKDKPYRELRTAQQVEAFIRGE